METVTWLSSAEALGNIQFDEDSIDHCKGFQICSVHLQHLVFLLLIRDRRLLDKASVLFSLDNRLTHYLGL
jgi:hypothetical protein|tara:strand:+ start:464 stop:676 length:213 start_codon:yes stop_codon:yes gene_type:complete